MERILEAVIAFREGVLARFLRRKSYFSSFAWISLFFVYCSIHYVMGGFHAIHLLLSIGLISAYLLHRNLRALTILLIPILLHVMIYDAFRYIPFEKLLPIHIIEPYLFDQAFFSLKADGKVWLLYEYMARYTNPWLNFLCGFVYYLHDFVVLAMSISFWLIGLKEVAQKYTAAFLLMNLFAFVTYYYYPAAAPWYVIQHGFTQPTASILGNPAGLKGLDQLLGINISSFFYQMNPVVFGAIPSMHAGFTMLSALYSFRLKTYWAVIINCYALFTFFSAIYLKHHYLIDILLGILYACVSFYLIEKLLAQFVKKSYGWLYKLLYF